AGGGAPGPAPAGGPVGGKATPSASSTPAAPAASAAPADADKGSATPGKTDANTGSQSAAASPQAAAPATPSASASPAAPAAPAASADPASTGTRFYRGRVTARGGLALHSRPDRGSQVLRVARQGEDVWIYCKTPGQNVQGNNLWYLLADGTWAWGAARYIDNIGPAPRWC
ncbi:SH3 domain-containing protein, partial [Streptomyces sp. NPDC085995]|uniref:SH3 domain-containing protein n=1 Tax=Streptomyces sp. NPDC085995 TaxID=3154861 RepID=UPI00343CDE5D